MGSNWKTTKLLDHYDIRSGLSKPAKDFGSGHPFLTFKDVFYNYFTPDELGDLVQSNDKERENCSVKRGDVFLTRTSETMHELGMSCVALQDYENATFNGFCKRLRPHQNSELVPEYVGYYLRSPKFRQSMLAFSTMSTRASLNNEMIGRLEISYPPEEEQIEIARVLKNLDDKITLNRQINQTLEQMAQALFKSWFVDFDPVVDNALDAGFFEQDLEFSDELLRRAKFRKAVRESADFKRLPEEIRQLFPAAFEECSEPSLGLGGWVPEGWLETKLSELVDTVSKTYPLKTVDEVIFLNTGDIENGDFLHANYSKVDGLPGQAKKSIRKGDILFSEIRPKNKRFAYVGFESNNYVVSTKLMVLRAKDVFNPLFAYFLLTLNQTTDELQRIAELRSGTFPQITFNELSLIQFVLPSTGRIMERFVSLYLEPFFEKSSSNRQENESLVNLRDTLLPKLISGEIQLNENEAEIASAVLI
ncbi:restriction endonuclease subunit S [Enterobacter sp. C2]|uniref:restriction endonuclease subunit S n=1 Tax=Enterobacter sp. C2 TaxID=2870346 RepID=UPI001CA43A17|nr:restriction endonuclease subunit S [Enterobacter sp. C2]